MTTASAHHGSPGAPGSIEIIPGEPPSFDHALNDDVPPPEISIYTKHGVIIPRN
jgi:hypothetical protein